MLQRVVEDPVLMQRFSFRRTTDEDGGEVLHVETWVDPGGGVTPHIHPVMDECFKVLGGRPSFLAGRKWQTASPGDTVVVPPASVTPTATAATRSPTWSARPARPHRYRSCFSEIS
jgi:quercetin dioxygenase-like cupin family protein